MSSTLEQGTYMGVSKKSKRWGLVFLVGPYLILVLDLFAWAISNFIISTSAMLSMTPTEDGLMTLSSGDRLATMARLLNVAMGFLGIFALLGMIVGIPLACYFFSRKEPMQGTFDPRSGKGDASIVPEEIKKWSWGGFLLGAVWGLYYQIWLSLLLFVPFLNVIMCIYLGMKGKELAWRKNVWPSVEAFNASQKKWDTGGIVILVIWLTLIILPWVL